MNRRIKQTAAAAILLAILLAGWLLLRDTQISWTKTNSLRPVSLTISSDTGDPRGLITAIDQSLAYYNKIDPKTRFWFGEQWCSASDMITCLEDFKEKFLLMGYTADFFEYVNQNYTAFRTAGDPLLLTGYFEASLKGSRKKSMKYRYPLYRKPDDLVQVLLPRFPLYSKASGLPFVLRGRLTGERKVIPYYSREDIDEGGILENLGLELFWVNDRIDLFFLHIQGSAIIHLDSGEKVRVNYADTNGHPYRAIGKVLVDRGICGYDELSMQYIENYLREHPGEITGVLNYNPSYIFFREVEDGPVGSLGVRVTTYRSIATDRFIFPRGSLCFLQTRIPEFDGLGDIIGEKPFRSFVLNQDTGGAIRTPARADLFTGNGEKSEWLAGHLKEEATLYFMIRKDLLK